VTVNLPGPVAAPAGGAAQAARPTPSHNAGASSSAKTVVASSSLLAIPAVPSVSSTTELTPSLFPTPLEATTAATAPSAVNPFSPSSPPATARSFGQSLLVSQDQILRSPRQDPEDDVDDIDTTGSAVDDKEQEQAQRFIKIVEKPEAVAPTTDPEQKPEPPSAPIPGPFLPAANLESVLDVPDYRLLTALVEAASPRPESAPKAPDSSRGFLAVLGAYTLSTGALLLALPAARASLGRWLERKNQSSMAGPEYQVHT